MTPTILLYPASRATEPPPSLECRLASSQQSLQHRPHLCLFYNSRRQNMRACGHHLAAGRARPAYPGCRVHCASGLCPDQSILGAQAEERGRGVDGDPDGPTLVCLTFPSQVFVVALCLIWKMTSLQKSRNLVIQTPC